MVDEESEWFKRAAEDAPSSLGPQVAEPRAVTDHERALEDQRLLLEGVGGERRSDELLLTVEKDDQ